MINKYQKGIRFERKLVNAARAKGLISLRSAGSKSKIDVVIIDTKNKKVDFIQAKTGAATLTKKELEEFEANSDEYMVKFRLEKDG